MRTLWARITTFPDTLSGEDRRRQQHRVRGRLALRRRRLLLEAYLDTPVDMLLSAIRYHSVRREKIFEVTSLASQAPHLVGSFLRKIIACGEAAGFEWAFFTATLPLKALLERLSLPLLPLADANSSRVANPDAWGSYYTLAPGFMPSTATTSRRASASARRRFMVELLQVLREPSRYAAGVVAMSDDVGAIAGQDLISRVAGLGRGVQRAAAGDRSARRRMESTGLPGALAGVDGRQNRRADADLLQPPPTRAHAPRRGPRLM